MHNYVVQAKQRPNFDGAWRAGRKWSSEDPTFVELVDSDDDPPLERGHVRIGRKAFRALDSDPHLQVWLGAPGQWW